MRCAAKEAYKIDRELLQRLFDERGEKDSEGRLHFPSKRALTRALAAMGIAAGNAGASDWIGALMEQFCVPADCADRRPDKPIHTSAGPRNAVIFTWCPPKQGPVLVPIRRED